MTSTTPMSAEDTTSVRKEIVVPASPDLAFAVFTSRFAQWWPGYHMLDGEIAEYVLDAVPGGRCYERATDGRECDWARVLAVDPPSRLLLSWEIGATWRPDPEHATEVEVTFTATADGTRVVLEHRHLDRAGDGWQAMRDTVGGDQGWASILAAYADVVRAAG
jgi:uncharacterized protein YndB with AHSA1/START domain